LKETSLGGRNPTSPQLVMRNIASRNDQRRSSASHTRTPVAAIVKMTDKSAALRRQIREYPALQRITTKTQRHKGIKIEHGN